MSIYRATRTSRIMGQKMTVKSARTTTVITFQRSYDSEAPTPTVHNEVTVTQLFVFTLVQATSLRQCHRTQT